jgi:hypothetical protein
MKGRTVPPGVGRTISGNARQHCIAIPLRRIEAIEFGKDIVSGLQAADSLYAVS